MFLPSSCGEVVQTLSPTPEIYGNTLVIKLWFCTFSNIKAEHISTCVYRGQLLENKT